MVDSFCDPVLFLSVLNYRFQFCFGIPDDVEVVGAYIFSLIFHVEHTGILSPLISDVS